MQEILAFFAEYQYNLKGICFPKIYDAVQDYGEMEVSMSNEMEKDTILLEFEDAEAVECDVVAIFENNGKEYIALTPAEVTEEEESEVFIYRYKEVGEDEFEMEDIEDDAEFDAAVDKLEEIIAE